MTAERVWHKKLPARNGNFVLLEVGAGGEIQLVLDNPHGLVGLTVNQALDLAAELEQAAGKAVQGG